MFGRRTRLGVRLAPLLACVVCGAAFVLASAARGQEYIDLWYKPSDYGPERPLAELIAADTLAFKAGAFLADPRIEIDKSVYVLRLYSGDSLLKRYRIQLGKWPRGPKKRRYDGRTPTGSYRICGHNRGSKYYLSLQIDYPNEQDIAGALEAKRITPGQAQALRDDLACGKCPSGRTKLGGEIFIHGQLPRVTREVRAAKRKKSTRTDLQSGDLSPGALKEFYNWTLGCIGMTNPDIRELFRFLPDGTPVEIRE